MYSVPGVIRTGVLEVEGEERYQCQRPIKLGDPQMTYEEHALGVERGACWSSWRSNLSLELYKHSSVSASALGICEKVYVYLTKICVLMTFICRCKLFYKKGDGYKDRGVGLIHLKKPGKSLQLLVRADTNLGECRYFSVFRAMF